MSHLLKFNPLSPLPSPVLPFVFQYRTNVIG